MKGKRKVFGWLSCLAVFLSALWPCACSYAARESDFSLILAVDEARISAGAVTARATFRNLTAQTMKIVGTREAGEEMISIYCLPAGGEADEAGVSVAVESFLSGKAEFTRERTFSGLEPGEYEVFASVSFSQGGRFLRFTTERVGVAVP